MRNVLIVLLSMGVIGGFGSGFARLAYYKGYTHGSCSSRYGGDDGPPYGYGRFNRYGQAPQAAPVAAPPAPAAAPAPVYIVIPQAAAPAAAAAPIIINGTPVMAAPAAPAGILQPVTDAK